MRILISAYACSPFQGSEASMGWGFINELSKHHKLTVFVESEKFQSDIEIFLKDDTNYSKINFIYVRKRRNRWLRKIWPPSYYKYYKEWHLNVFQIAKDLHSKEKLDLVHQLTMSGFREPGFLWKIDAPFVWGPVGAMGYFPKQFLTHIGAKGFIHYVAYNFYNFMHMNFLRRPKKAAKKAGIGLISATTDNKERFFQHWNANSTLINEIGIPHFKNNNGVSLRQEAEPLRIVWSGLHTPRKALNIGLKSLSLLPDEIDWELHILGDGEVSYKWKNYAKSLGISNKCIFHGMVDRDKVLEVMTGSHLMLITSLRDLTSAVTVESISMALPVICLDHSGFSDVIDDTCGIKIPLTNFNQVTSDISNAVKKLALDNSYREMLSIGAMKRAESFSWDKKVQDLNNIYKKKFNEFHAHK